MKLTGGRNEKKGQLKVIFDKHLESHKIKKGGNKMSEKYKNNLKKLYIFICEEKGNRFVYYISGEDFTGSPEQKAIRELEKNTGFGFKEKPEIIDKLLNKSINKKEIIASFNPIVKQLYQEAIKIIPDETNYTLLKIDFDNKKSKIYEAFLKRTGRI